MRVKVCGLTDKTDLQKLSEIQPDYMGFIFYSKSKRFMKDRDVAKQNYPKIKKVGVFVNKPIEQVIEIVMECNLNMVQLHGDETTEYCAKLKKEGIEIIQAFAVDDDFDFSTTRPYEQVSTYFLFDTKGEQRGGNGYSFNWDKLKEYRGSIPFFLSGGIRDNDVKSIKNLKHDKLFGVDINSRFEAEPGQKKIVMIKTFMNEIKA